MKRPIAAALLFSCAWSLVISCGSSDSKKNPHRDYGGEGGEGTPGAGGTESHAGVPGLGGADEPGGAGQPGAGAMESGGASGGSATSEGGTSNTGDGGTTNTGEGGAAAGAGGDGPTVDLSACDVAGDACCLGDACGNGLECAGLKCTCTNITHGSALVRVDGRLLVADSSSQTPVKSSETLETLDQVTSAWQGHYHGCASRQDGSAWCWASSAEGNNQGQLGNGTTAVSSPTWAAVRVQLDPSPAAGPVYLTDVRSVQEGFTGYLGSVSCAVTNAGKLYCWGVKTDGNLMQTGNNTSYATPIKLDAQTPVSNAVQVAGGSRHACYLTTDTQVYCWGANIGGPLGNATETASMYPVRAGVLTGVSKIVAGPDFSCALVSSGNDAGRVFCWGSSGAGQIGLGAPAANTDGCINYCKKSPSRVLVDASTYLEDVVDIAAGYQTTCALKSDHSIWCWGSSGGVYAAALEAPSGTPITNVAGVAVHSGTPRVLLTDGTLQQINGSTLAAINVNCGILQ